ncbi:PAS domain-containing protein, partial [Methylobacterium trifolii]
MKHPTSRMLHAYWDRLRGERAAPERAEIEPGQIRHLLADSLILELDLPLRSATLRLAGTRICALFGRELKGVPFAGLWRGFDGAGLPVAHGADPWRIVEMVALDTAGVVAGLRGTTAAGESLDLELVLLPLRHHGRTHVRALGTLSPVLAPPWLGLHPLVRLETTTLRVLSAAAPDSVGDGLPG